MALQSNDLFVVQSQSDSKLYKLKLSDLITEVEGGAGVNFKGSVDLNNAPGDQTPEAITLPGQAGDLYIVESDAAAIAVGWVMQGGETAASQGDRIVYDGDSNDWILIASGSDNAGTVTGVTATLPLKSDGDSVDPVISIRQARTSTGAGTDGDGEGTAGAVARLAEAADVEATTGTGAKTAVVTADLLKATNDIVNGLALSPGGVTTVTTTDANSNSALTISPTAGNVVIELKTASDTEYGVVQIADASAITNGTAGSSAVIDASQLKAAIDALPDEAIDEITEGGTDIVSGALDIQETAVVDGKKQVTIGVKKETFAPYDFSTLPDISV
jgi:hypothetical protein